MSTLDPGDAAYRGYYESGAEGGDPMTAKGFNYHQGPEWLWPYGFYLRALLHFHDVGGSDKNHNGNFNADNLGNLRPLQRKKNTVLLQRLLREHRRHVRESAWAGLPELTNAGGVPCASSCPSQAWSMGCILDALHDAL